MYSISTPRCGSAPLHMPIHPHFHEVLFLLRRTTRKVRELAIDKKHLRSTIDFYNVLYPTDCDVETEAGLIKINTSALKRKLATCRVWADMGLYDYLKEELSMIPDDWAPDYMKPFHETHINSADNIHSALLKRVHEQPRWIRDVQSGDIEYTKGRRLI